MQSNHCDIRIAIGSRSSSVCRNQYSTRSRSRRDYADGYREDRFMAHWSGNRNVQRSSHYSSTACGWLSDVTEREQERCNRLDNRNSKRVHTNHPGTRYHLGDRFCSLSLIRKLSVVCKTILKKFSKPVIPFAAVSALFMTTAIRKASAASPIDQIMTVKGALFPFVFDKNNHIQMGALGKIGQNIPIAHHPSFMGDMELFFKTIAKIIVFFQTLPQNITLYTGVLTGKVFEWLVYLLQTPLFIFNSTNIKNASLVFTGISLLIVTFLTMIEGNKQMMRKKHTDFKKICQRYFVALVGAGIAPIAFEKTFQLINILTRAVAQIGSKEATPYIPMDSKVDIANAWLNALGLVAFDIMLLAMLIPVLLQNARRFFDLMILAAITPLALTSWIFDDHRHMFQKWWFNVKKMSITPLIYAVFVCLMGLLIFGTPKVTGAGLFIKLIIMIGGLSRMANPPTFIKSKMDGGPDAEDSLWNVWDTFKKAYRNLTFKNFRTTKELKKRLNKNKGGTAK